jgi:hypothetical protein
MKHPLGVAKVLRGRDQVPARDENSALGPQHGIARLVSDWF